MSTTGPGWYVVKVEEGRVVWVIEGPYDLKKAREAASLYARTYPKKVLYWNGKNWQKHHRS